MSRRFRQNGKQASFSKFVRLARAPATGIEESFPSGGVHVQSSTDLAAQHCGRHRVLRQDILTLRS